MNHINPQKAIEYAYDLGMIHKSVLLNNDEKLSTKQITELWDIQEALGLAELQSNNKEDVIKDIQECYVSLLLLFEEKGESDGFN